MHQQINLYQDELRPVSDPFGAGRVLGVILGLVLVLAAIWGYQSTQLKSLRGELAALDLEQEAAQTQIQTLETQFPPPAKSQLLASELAAARSELADKQALVQALSGGDFGNAEGLASYLEGIARGHVAGTWLTRVVIDNGGQALELGGKALSAELVPTYVRALARESSFAGQAFSELVITRDDASIGQVDFAIRTPGIGESGDQP